MLNKEMNYNEVKDIIEKQFENNRDRNIFYKENSNWLNDATINYLNNLFLSNVDLDEFDIKELSDYYLNLFEVHFYNANQYIYFDSKTKNEIIKLFEELVEELVSDRNIKSVEERHLKRLSELIIKSNPLIYKMNSCVQEKVTTFVCSEYSAEFLLQILDLNEESINEPILDIGCGPSGNLISYLNQVGYEAYGIDRTSENSNVIEVDFLIYDYGINKWGLIVSNLAFSSHFLHYHLNGDERAYEFAEVYMKILESLKVGGRFVYTPSLTFIEELLPKDLYVVERERVYDEFYRTEIIKL